MKKIKSLFVAILLIVGTTSIVNAQSQVAHINTQELIESMPEMKAAQSQIKKLEKTYDTQIKTLMKEFETKAQQYGNEQDNKTEEENVKRVKEIQGMQSNIADYREQALKDLQQKEVDLFQPILEIARTAIQKVGRAQGFQYVLDSSSGNGILLAEGKDLLVDVKKELGI